MKRITRLQGFAPLPPGTVPIVFQSMREKCAFLASIINVYSRDPRVRHHAFEVFQEEGAAERDKPSQIAALTRHFQGYYYLPEEVETFASPIFTITHGYGDCDDTMSALGACLKSVGIAVAPEILGRRARDGKVKWRHIYLRAHDGKRWIACETTRPIEPGVEPAWYVMRDEMLRRERNRT